MEINKWISGYKVCSVPWIDKKTIYFNVSYYAPGQSLEKPPVWEKTVYITDNEAGREMIRNFINSLTDLVAKLPIPQGGYAVLTF